jgi:hypothetical protein
MRHTRFSTFRPRIGVRLPALAFLIMLAPAAPVGAQVRRVTLGLHTSCPYGLVA